MEYVQRDPIDLSQLSVQRLLQLDAAILSELAERGLTRTKNKPLGDIAEQIVFRARGGVLAPNSMRSHDILDSKGKKIQVKAMTADRGRLAGSFGVFRSFDFDSAIFLVFSSGSYDLLLARETTPAEVRQVAAHRKHINGTMPSLRGVLSIGEDVMEEMQAAYFSLR